jgi:predicted amidohydrolase YtcJ
VSDTYLIHGGRIVTMDATLGSVEALAIRNGRIHAAGRLRDVAQSVPRETSAYDLRGRTVLPGLIDTHPHLLHYATLEDPLVAIWDACCHNDIVERIRARAAQTEAGQWIMTTPVGEPHYFVERSWKDLTEGRLPDRHVLDRATHDHPVMIQAWAPVMPNVTAFNSLALRMLGIDSTTPDRVGHVWIEKDRAGEPTGILKGSVTNYYSDDAFNQSLWKNIPFLQFDRMKPAVRRAMAAYNRQGVTAIYENHMMDPPLIDAYRQLRRENALSLRVLLSQEAESYGMPWSRPREMPDFIRRCEQAAESIELDDDFCRFNGMTILRDGSCWPGMIRMKASYRGPYGNFTAGQEFITPQKAETAMRICACCRMRLNTIALGTQAQEDNLTQLEKLATEFDIPALGWTLVHGFFVEEQQARRYARLGMDVTTSMSFVWGKTQLFRDRMGTEALGDLVPLRRLMDNGLTVAGGSDWGPKSAFKQIELAVTRAYAGAASDIDTTQAITREEALAMWTRDAAQVMRWRDIGTLAAGQQADFIVLDRDPLTCAVTDIGETQVEATILGGRAVHGALD